MVRKTGFLKLLKHKYLGESEVTNYTNMSVHKLMLLVTIVVGVIMTMTFSSHTYRQSGIFWQYLLSLSTVCFFMASYLTLNNKRIIIPTMLAVVPLFLHYLQMFYQGGHDGFQGIWVLCIPLVSLLLGLRCAFVISVSTFLFIAAVCFIPGFGYSYPVGIAGRYLGTYITISIFTFVYEYTKNEAHYEYVKELERIGQIDPLTELLNRRGFKQSVERLFKQALRDELPISFLMIDIDHFKKFNDTYGHPKGDVCLVSCVKIFKDCVRRPLDLIVRLGGEEFGIFLFNTGAKEAVHIAEKIRENIERTNIEVAPNTFASITASIGVSTVDLRKNHERKHFDFDELIAEADELLYAAKNSGRNQVLHSPAKA